MKPGSIADKRARAIAALTGPDAARSDREIAKSIAVSAPFISAMRKRLAAAAAVPANPPTAPAASVRQASRPARPRNAITELTEARYGTSEPIVARREPDEDGDEWSPYR